LSNLRRSLLCLLLGVFFLSLPGISRAGKGLSVGKVEKALEGIGVKGAKVQGVESLPMKGKVYLVFVKFPNGREAAFVMSEDARYLITGKVLDLSKNGKDITMEVGYSKGYLPLPKGTQAKEKVNITNSPAFGPAKAPKIIVFFDPLCPYCMKELNDLKPLADKGKLRLVLKYFIVHGDKARDIARNSLCLYEGGKKEEFWAYLFSHGNAKVQLPKCDDDKVEFILTRDGEEAKKLGLKGTPASIIKDKVYVGALGRVVVDKLLLTSDKEKK